MNKSYIIPILFLCIKTSFGQLKAHIDTSKYISTSTETGIIPETPPEYPGGRKQMVKFIMDNTMSKMTISKKENEIFQFPVANWVVDEKGNVTDVQIYRTSNVPKIDKMLIDAIQKMPKWKPATVSGRPVKSESRYPLRIIFK